eukprot:gb/GECG01001246.1/.p1 GENE.gb/GECG01001246.1/~~gb/GECG01001246.1/.p1  ORF type:complete len:1149 (+),score=165.77 gb/GECG01001246.1/:1-3447(+)
MSSSISDEDFKHEIAKVFHLTDEDGNGKADRTEVQELMKRFNNDQYPSEYEMVKVMEDLDTNKDGVISYKEFERGMLDWLKERFGEAPSSPGAGVGLKRQSSTSTSTSSSRKKIHVSLANYFTKHGTRDNADSILGNIKSQIFADEWTEFVDPITAERASEEDARELETLWKEVKEFCEQTDQLVERCNASNLQTASVGDIQKFTQTIEKMLSIIDYVDMPMLREDMRELLNEVFYHLRRHQVFRILSELACPRLRVIGDPDSENDTGPFQYGNNHVAILSSVLKSLYFYLVGPTSRSEDREELKHRYFVGIVKNNDESIAAMVQALFLHCAHPEVRERAIELLGALGSKDHHFRKRLLVDCNLVNQCVDQLRNVATGSEMVAILKTVSILCGETHGLPGTTLKKDDFEQLFGGTKLSELLCSLVVDPGVTTSPQVAEFYPLIVSHTLTALSHLLPFIRFKDEALWNTLLKLSQNRTLWEGMIALQTAQSKSQLPRKTRQHAVNCRNALRAILGVIEVAVQLHEDYTKTDIEALTETLIEPLMSQTYDQSIATSSLKLFHMLLEENLVSHEKIHQELLGRVCAPQSDANSEFAAVQILHDVAVKGSRSQFQALLQGGLISRLLSSFEFFKERDVVLAHLYSYADPLVNVELASVALDTMKWSLERAQEIGEDLGNERGVLQCLGVESIDALRSIFEIIYRQKFRMVDVLSSTSDVDSYLKVLEKEEVRSSDKDSFTALESVERKLCSVVEIVYDLHSRYRSESSLSSQTAEKLEMLKNTQKETAAFLRTQLNNRRQGLSSTSSKDRDLLGKSVEGPNVRFSISIVVRQEDNPQNFRSMTVSSKITLRELKNQVGYVFGGPVELKYEESNGQQKGLASEDDWRRAIVLSQEQTPPKITLLAYDAKHGGRVFDVSKYSCPEEAIDEIKTCCNASVSFDEEVTSRLFQRFQEMRTSSLTYEQFATVLTEEGINKDDDDNRLRLLFNAFDKSNDGKIDFQEIIVGLATMYNGEPIDRLRLAFDSVDEDGDGFLSFEEVEKLAKKSILLSKTLERRFDAHQVARDVMASCDHNNDQQLSWSEFQEAVFFNFPILAAPFMNFGGQPNVHHGIADRNAPFNHRKDIPGNRGRGKGRGRGGGFGRGRGRGRGRDRP